MMNFLANFIKKKTILNFKQLVENGALIIDVRSKEEYNMGHINGSMNIPISLIGMHLTELKRREYAVITVCHSGTRSGVAKEVFIKNNIEAYNGGSWLELKKEIA